MPKSDGNDPSHAHQPSNDTHPLFDPLFQALHSYVGFPNEIETTLPPWASTYGVPSKSWACLDVLSLPLNEEPFQIGLLWAQRYILRRPDTGGFPAIFHQIMTPKVSVDTSNPATLCLKSLVALEKSIADRLVLRGVDLEKTMMGFHYGWIISTIANRWQIVLDHFDKELFMSSELNELCREMSEVTNVHDWLGADNGSNIIKFPNVASMLRGSMFGRIQLICYRCEFLVTWMHGLEEVKDCYDCGTASWQLGWFRTPPEVCDLIHDVLRGKLV